MKIFIKIAVIILSVLAILWLIGLLLFCNKVHELKTAEQPELSDAIIVLTGSYGRIEKGLELFADGRASTLFISGVDPRVNEDRIRQRWKKEDKELPSCCIYIDYNSSNTFENAVHISDWIKTNNMNSAIIVTHRYHMPRVMMELRNRLPEVKLRPFALVTTQKDGEEKYNWPLIFTEYNKILYVYIRNRLQSWGNN